MDNYKNLNSKLITLNFSARHKGNLILDKCYWWKKWLITNHWHVRSSVLIMISIKEPLKFTRSSFKCKMDENKNLQTGYVSEYTSYYIHTFPISYWHSYILVLLVCQAYRHHQTRLTSGSIISISPLPSLTNIHQYFTQNQQWRAISTAVSTNQTEDIKQYISPVIKHNPII